MRILITGGAGFVGRAFVRRLVAEGGHDITVVDSRCNDDPGWLDLPDSVTGAVRLVIDDVRTWRAPRSYDLCVHLAAVVGGREKIEGEPLAVATDLAIDATLINAVAEGLADELMYFSSSAAYPVYAQRRDEALHQLDESLLSFGNRMLGTPDMTYGWAKLTGEYLVQFLDDTKVTVYRPFSGYGEDQMLCYPFPAIMQRAVDREDPLTVWGTGEQARDWIHIDDAVRMALALHREYGGGTYNLCTGRAVPFREFARLAAEAVGYEPGIESLPDKPEGVFWRVGSPALTDSLGVRAETTLEQGMRLWLEANDARV